MKKQRQQPTANTFPDFWTVYLYECSNLITSSANTTINIDVLTEVLVPLDEAISP